jgi:hypothetical protein
MSIQFIQRKMVMIARETLIALFNDIIEGLARFGCGLAGIPYEG